MFRIIKYSEFKNTILQSHSKISQNFDIVSISIENIFAMLRNLKSSIDLNIKIRERKKEKKLKPE